MGTFSKSWYYLLTGNVAAVDIVAGADPITFDCWLRSGETFRAVAPRHAVQEILDMV